VDGEGVVRARASRPLGIRFPAPGRVEQDGEEMWQASRSVLNETLRAAGERPADVAGIGVVTQRSTVLAWETGSGQLLAPAIGWQDRRTAERTAELRARGVPINTQASATKLQWLLEENSRVRAAADAGRLRFGTPDVWLTERLCGSDAFVTDPGQASCTALYDAETGDWSDSALAFFGIPRETLPRIAATAEIVGECAAEILGAPVAVAARAGDQQAACFAQGVHEPGRAKLTLGTSAMLDFHCGERASGGGAGTYPVSLWRLPGLGDHVAIEGTFFTAGAAVDWLVELGVLAKPAALDSLAGSVLSSDGVAFLPALHGLGTPWMDDDARGLLVGLTRGTTAAHLARACIDGLAQRCADLCEAVGFADGPLPVDGGLAASDLLLQTVADTTGLPIQRPAEIETTALGAALLAGLATGVYPDLSACRATAEPTTTFEPRSEPAERAHRRQRWSALVSLARQSDERGDVPSVVQLFPTGNN